jgi:two-component system response regulator YesN
MHYLEDIKRVKNEFLQDIYTGSDTQALKEADLFQLNQDYNVSFIEGCFQVLVIKPDFEYQPNNQETMRMLLCKISKIVDQCLTDICSEVLWLLLEDRIYILVNYKTEDKKKFRKALNNIIDESHLFRDIVKNLMITVSVGNAQTSLGSIGQSTDEVKEALVDRILMGSGKIIQYNSELHMKKSAESIVSFEKRRKLIDLIEILNAAEIKKWIDEIELEISKLPNISGQFILDTIYEIVDIILYGLKNHANVKAIDKGVINEFHEALLMQNNVRTVFEVANKYVGRMLQQSADDRKNESNRPIKEAQKYINEHYASAVNLEEVSAVIGFNATYFSTLFKKETGINFLEYVTIVRIKAAKQLLADSRKSILDISHQVGYNDFKHFTKQFKKVTGLTPSEYRKLYY